MQSPVADPIAIAADRPLRVCFMIDELAPAGTECHLVSLIRTLDRARVKPYLCLLRGNDPVSRGMEPKDCEVLRLGIGSLHGPGALTRAWRFIRFLRHEKIDLVQTYFTDSTHFGVPLARLAGVPRVLRARRSLSYWGTPLHRRMARLYTRLVDATVTNCEACRREVVSYERASPEDVIVLENGIDLDRFTSIDPVSPPTGDRPLRIGMVANLRPIKGPDVFIRAAGILRSSHPDAVFCIIGEEDTGEHQERLMRLAGECGIADRLELPGTVADVPGFLAGLHVAVLASRSEGLSNALIEYMAAARPIVATAVGGNVELIEHESRGLIVPPEDPAALAGAIGRLLCDYPLASQLGAAARRWAIEHYSLEAMTRRFEELYHRLVRSPREVLR